VTSREVDSGLSGISRGDGAIARIADRANRANLTTLLGVGAVVGAVAGVARAMRSHSDDDIITGKVSIDLLKKVELLTIRLHLHRS